MNSSQYYEMIRELQEINRKLDLLVTRPNITYTYTPPPPYDTGEPVPLPHTTRVGGCGPLGAEQELPFNEPHG